MVNTDGDSDKNDIDEFFDDDENLFEHTIGQIVNNVVTDVDGNTYNGIWIGNQLWMKENLRTTRYDDGMNIPMSNTWSNTEPYCYAHGLHQCNEENSNNISIFGYLYNWAAVMRGTNSSNDNPSGVQGICPKGWHVPSDTEWEEMINTVKKQSVYCCDDYIDCKRIAKSLSAKNTWTSCTTDTCAPGYNPSTNNATGFSALPAGYCSYGIQFNDFGKKNTYWSSTEVDDKYGAHNRSINYEYSHVFESLCDSKNYGYSVRCVRD